MEGSLSVWEQIFLVVVAVGVVFLFRPGIRRALEESRQARERDWMAVLVPIAIVVLFVVFLVAVT